jgi:hypothetical protein
MHGRHDVGTSVVQDLVAALQVVEVVERQVELLERGTHTAVRDEDPPVQFGEKPTVHVHTRSLDSISAAASLP